MHWLIGNNMSDITDIKKKKNRDLILQERNDWWDKKGREDAIKLLRK